MVISLILNFIADAFATVMSIMPSVGIQDIPYIGEAVYTYWVLAVSYMHTAFTIIPFTEIVWNSFVYVIIPFEFSLLILKVFLGSRTPINS